MLLESLKNTPVLSSRNSCINPQRPLPKTASFLRQKRCCKAHLVVFGGGGVVVVAGCVLARRGSGAMTTASAVGTVPIPPHNSCKLRLPFLLFKICFLGNLDSSNSTFAQK